jgi:transcriptional regulator with XRE-family HTH domain
MSINIVIRRRREEKKITRDDMSKSLGMTLNGYGKIERGEVDITIKRLCQISKILELPIVDFFNESNVTYGFVRNACKDPSTTEESENQGGVFSGFDSQMYIEFLEQRIAWLKAQLATQTANEVES